MKKLIENLALLLSTSLVATACIVDLDQYVGEFDQRLLYAPAEGLEASTQSALDSLKAATGADFSIVPGIGTEIRWGTAEELTICEKDKDGKEVCAVSCAQTRVLHDKAKVIRVGIIVRENIPEGECMALDRTIEHEIIHSVRRQLDLGLENQGHTKTGVFQAVANSNDNRLNEESLMAVCEANICSAFNPEE